MLAGVFPSELKLHLWLNSRGLRLLKISDPHGPLAPILGTREPLNQALDFCSSLHDKECNVLFCAFLLNVGLVELITESETLRKIQVKHGHGLAGSFKDRPIAEWLQIQNPTELEYQKVWNVNVAPESAEYLRELQVKIES